MRMPDVQEPTGMTKEKKQLLVLGVLALVLVGVMAMQFGQGEDEAELALLADEPVAAAATSMPGTTADQPPVGMAKGNVVLGGDPLGGGTNDGVFESFWSVASPMDAKLEELPPPPITLNATIVTPGGAGPLAVIDGNMRRPGDEIGGWLLDSVRVREVSLRSPSDRIVTVAMPLLQMSSVPNSSSPPRAPVPRAEEQSPDLPSEDS